MGFINSSLYLLSGIAAIVTFAAILAFAIVSGKLSFPNKGKRQDDDAIRENLIKALKRHTSLTDMEVLGKTTLKNGEDTMQFDAIILNNYGTIAIKACFAQGDIYGEYRDEKWCSVDKDGTKHYFDNPVPSLHGSTKLFKEIYAAEKVKSGMCDAFIVAPAKDAELFVNKRAEVYNLKTLSGKLSEDKYQTNKGADIKAMKAALEKYSVK